SSRRRSCCMWSVCGVPRSHSCTVSNRLACLSGARPEVGRNKEEGIWTIMRHDSLSVVIPVYNSEGSLAQLVARLCPVLQAQGVPFEIILVNDGSRDRSGEVIARLARERPQVRGIELSRNYGQHSALLCGIRAARHAVL